MLLQGLPLQVQDPSVKAVIAIKAEAAPAYTDGAAAQQPARELLQNLPNKGEELECLNLQSSERPTLEEEVHSHNVLLQLCLDNYCQKEIRIHTEAQCDFLRECTLTRTKTITCCAAYKMPATCGSSAVAK